MTPGSAIDLFAGPGGWDVGAAGLGFEPLGVEWDDAACATRRAAGLPTLQADVSALDPLSLGPCDLLIGSPPCQAFSNAGKGGGHQDAPVIYRVMRDLLAGRDTRAEQRPAMVDQRSLLVAEPLRWILALRPRRVALEQVPPVMPFWEWLAEALGALGYAAITCLLSSEQFGVPQTRSRAFMMASLDGPVRPPSPTHRRYVAMRRETDHDTLFDPGPRERIVAPGEDNLLPWVSMAEALGWGPDGRVGFARLNDLDDGEEYRERDFRDADEPALNLTSKARSWKHEVGEQPAGTLCGHHTPRWAYRGGSQENATERPLDEPAPTVLFGHNKNEVSFVRRERSGDRAEDGFDPGESPSQALTSKTRSWTVRTGTNTMSKSRRPEDAEEYEREVDAPSPTLTAKTGTAWTVDRPAPTLLATHRSDEGGLVGHQLPAGEGRNIGGKNWVDDRPATTVAGDPRVHPPGHKENRFDPPDTFEQRRGENAIRITIAEASILQGFPPTHPWQGSRTKQFEQVGNCVPPPVAMAVLEATIRDA